LNKLESTVRVFYKIIRHINKVTGSVGMICLAAMMFLTAADVILRYAINKPITGSYELIQFMMVITVSLGLSYTALEKGHVTLDIVTSHLPKRARGIIDSVVGLLGLIMAVLMTWQACIYVTTIQKSQVTSTVLLVPMYPFVAFAAFGLAFFSLVLVLHILEFILAGSTK
jgi:TRAP-type C4-dicarboxylate transport system permease small subunit